MICHSLLAFLLITLSFNTFGANGQTPDFVLTAPSITIRPLSTPKDAINKDISISGSYQAEKRQSPATEGLKVQFDVTSQSDHTIQLNCFPDYVYVSLFNEKRELVPLPEVLGRTEQRGNLAIWTPDTRKLAVPYRILSLKVNDRELTNKEIYEDRIIELLPHGHITYQIAIDRVMLPVVPPAKGVAIPGTDKVKVSKDGFVESALPSGIYRISPNLTLFEARPGKSSNSLSTGWKEKDQVTVDYTRPAAKK